MNEFIVIDSTEKLLILIGFIISILCLLYVIFIYYFNKYYTKKHKNDFFNLFWGYEDKENKISADEKLSLFIYHFLNAYNLNSYKYFNKRYKFFPENIKDMDPASYMPNATKGNLESFEKRHSKWIKFNIISLHIIVFLFLSIFFLFYISDKFKIL